MTESKSTNWSKATVIVAVIAIVVSIVFSASSLGFSCYTWHSTTQSPAKFSYEFSLPILSYTSYTSYDSDPNNLYFSPIIPINIVNSGAKVGVIYDFRLVVKNSEDSKLYILQPTYYCDKYSISTLSEENKEVFHPLLIQGKEDTYKIVLFLKSKDNLKPWTISDSVPDKGTWTFEYYVLTNNTSKYELIKTQSFVLTRDQLQGGNWIPDDIEKINANKRLYDTFR